MGGNWKFLVIVTGVDSAKAEFACMWCKCPKSQRHNIDKVISDVSHGPRTIEENCTLSKKHKSFTQTTFSQHSPHTCSH